MHALVGTGFLIRLILRRDRFLLPIWIFLPVFVAVITAASFAKLYQTAGELQNFASQVAGSPAEVAMLGPVYAATLGGLIAWRWIVPGVVIAGVASLLTVVRHTRTEEETGRRELLGATVIGRQAALSAALIVALGANLLIGILVALGLISLGLPAAGSVALSLSAAAASLTFAVVGGVAAQLTESAGAAKGIAGALLGLSYLLRAVGDGSGLGWLSWLSPIGWVQSVRPFADERWWIFALFTGAVVVSAITAYTLSSRRDLGAGLLPPRLGRATASPVLRNPLALAWRLHWGMLLAWSAGFAIVGIALGFNAKTIADQLAASPQFMEMLARLGGSARVSDSLFTLYLMLFGEMAAVYAIQSALQPRFEEVAMRAEPVLATAVSRIQWVTSHLVFTAIGPAVVLAAFGLTAGLTYGLTTGEVGSEVSRVVPAALAYLPAIWVLAGTAVMMFGVAPRFAVLSWAALAGIFVIELLGEFQLVDQTVLDISPFAHVPRVLVGDTSAIPLIWLTGISAALTALGLVGFRRRDVG